MYAKALALVLAGFTTFQAVPAQAAANRCFDGSCTITVTHAVSFRVSSRFGITKVSIVRKRGGVVKVSGSGNGASMWVSFDRYGSGRLNNLVITPISIKSHSAKLRFRPL